MCKGKFSVFILLSLSSHVWPGICEKNWQKLLQNCQSSAKSHHIRAYHFSICVSCVCVCVGTVQCTHFHMMPIYIVSQAIHTSRVHSTMLSECTHVHTLYSIWIYEVNIISFYFISFFTIKIFFIATQSVFTHTPHMCVCVWWWWKFVSKSFINAKIVCLDTFFVGVDMIVSALLLASSTVSECVCVLCGGMRTKDRVKFANKTIIMFNQKSQQIH